MDKSGLSIRAPRINVFWATTRDAPTASIMTTGGGARATQVWRLFAFRLLPIALNRPPSTVRRPLLFALAFFVVMLLTGAPAWAQDQGFLPRMGIDADSPTPEDVTITLQLLFLMTVLSLLPSIAVMTTSFIRISVVLGFVRRAIGTQQTPSNQIIVGLALFLTLFIMTPVFEEMYRDAIRPYLDNETEALQPGDIDPFGQQVDEVVPKFYVMLQQALIPLRNFMWGQINLSGANDVAVLMAMAGMDKPEEPNDVPTHVLIPAFMINELKIAFMMGFIIFIPFLILDIVTSSVLISMGMFQLPPAFISLPFKVLLFVLVDGWSLLIHALGLSFFQNMNLG